MHIFDIVILVIYIIGLLFIGFYVGRDNKTQADYFVASRSMHWFPIATSIAASTISANGFIGGPGWAYDSGLKAFMLQISIPLVLTVACVVFIPFLYNLRVISCYEYLEKRLGPKSHTAGAVGFLAVALIQVSAMIYTPSLIFSHITGYDIKLVMPAVVVVSVIYTSIGGIKADIWSDFIQMFILWGGLIAAFVICLSSLDMGMLDVLATVRSAGKLNALDFSLDLSMENGAWVTLVGGFIMWLQYYVTDQSQVQRMLTAKSVNEVQRSISTGGCIMNIMYFIFMLLGLLLYCYYGGKEFQNTNMIMTSFIMERIPVGILGLIVAAMFAAALSSIDSILNSMTTVFVKDIYERRPGNDGSEASLKVSRRFTLLTALLISLFTYFAYMGTTASVLAVVGGYISYLCGSILALFALGMFTRRATDCGAVLGFVVGIAVTAIVAQTTSINWLWYNLVGAVCCYIAGYAASLILKDKQPEHVEQFTYQGQRRLILAQQKANPEMLQNLPGKMTRSAWMLVAFFIVQCIFLYLICL